MLTRAVADREEMVNLLNRTYKLTSLTDVLALNVVLRTLQDKVVQWDQDFTDIEKAFMPSEKDLRRMTANHLKRLFANQDAYGTLDRSVAGLTVSEADEKEVTPAESVDGTTGDDAASKENAGCDAQNPNSVEEGEATPVVGLFGEVSNPYEEPIPTRNYDSDSTISAMHVQSPRGLAVSNSMGSADDFVSRLPRRSRPTAR